MTAAAKQRGVILTSQSRPLRADDFSQFDYIIGMDPKNLRAMQACIFCCPSLQLAYVHPFTNVHEQSSKSHIDAGYRGEEKL